MARIQNIEFSLIFSHEFISWIHNYEIWFMNSDLILWIFISKFTYEFAYELRIYTFESMYMNSWKDEHLTARAQDRATTNCRTNWQSSKQLKLDTILDAWQKHFISPSQSDSLRLWQNAMADFCSDDFAVWEAPASLKRSIEVILCIELKMELLWKTELIDLWVLGEEISGNGISTIWKW